MHDRARHWCDVLHSEWPVSWVYVVIGAGFVALRRRCTATGSARSIWSSVVCEMTLRSMVWRTPLVMLMARKTDSRVV